MQAWEEDPLDTLKLIAHLRDVRDGKADRDLFHDCIAWLWEHHPLTLLANLEEIVKVNDTAACFSKGSSLDHIMPWPCCMLCTLCITWTYLEELCNYTAWHAAGLCDALN